jgi:hypothetical protein
MTRRVTSLAVVALAGALQGPVVLVGQTQLMPSYLAEMPAPARVLQEIKGKDVEDTIERQMGAFQALMKVIDDLAWGLEKRYLPTRATPDESRLKLAYGQAYADLWHRAKNNEGHRYDHDPVLLVELLTKLVSPGFRDRFLKADANAAALYAEYSKPNAGAAPVQPAPSRAPVTASAIPQRAPAAPAQPATVDPSIAKARAARVDTKVFGIALGEPVRLPVCPKVGLFGLPDTTLTCLVGEDAALNDVAALAAPLLGLSASDLKGDPNFLEVQLSADNCPSWMNGCTITGGLQNGVLVWVQVPTRGRNVEQAIGRELRGKYGQVLFASEGTVTPDTGNPFKVTDLEWVLPGLHVEYTVILHSESDVTDTRVGQVRIEAESIYQRRKAEEQQKARPKL